MFRGSDDDEICSWCGVHCYCSDIEEDMNPNNEGSANNKEFIMAKVYAKVTGGKIQEVEASTVAGVRDALGLSADYTVVVSGNGASDSDSLNNDDVVVFSAKVKGGLL